MLRPLTALIGQWRQGWRQAHFSVECFENSAVFCISSIFFLAIAVSFSFLLRSSDALQRGRARSCTAGRMQRRCEAGTAERLYTAAERLCMQSLASILDSKYSIHQSLEVSRAYYHGQQSLYDNTMIVGSRKSMQQLSAAEPRIHLGQQEALCSSGEVWKGAEGNERQQLLIQSTVRCL